MTKGTKAGRSLAGQPSRRTCDTFACPTTAARPFSRQNHDANPGQQRPVSPPGTGCREIVCRRLSRTSQRAVSVSQSAIAAVVIAASRSRRCPCPPHPMISVQPLHGPLPTFSKSFSQAVATEPCQGREPSVPPTLSCDELLAR